MAHQVDQKLRVVVTPCSGDLAHSAIQQLAKSSIIDSVSILEESSDELRESAYLTSFAASDVVVHLGIALDDRDPYLRIQGHAVDDVQALLAAAARSDVRQVIVVSSALVLGARPNNPMPLTEAAQVRPEPAFRPAVELAEIERLVAEQDAPATTFAVLRAAPVVGDGNAGWLAKELHSSLAYSVGDNDPPMQYLHATDLGDAIAQTLLHGVSGVIHVAPDGMLSGAQRRALETLPRVSVPDFAGLSTARLRAVLRGTKTPEGIRPYLEHPWFLANDRLRDLGWLPKMSNEQAYTAAFPPAPWSLLGSGKRQELLFGALGTAGIVAGVGIGAAIRRRRH